MPPPTGAPSQAGRIGRIALAGLLIVLVLCGVAGVCLWLISTLPWVEQGLS